MAGDAQRADEVFAVTTVTNGCRRDRPSTNSTSSPPTRSIVVSRARLDAEEALREAAPDVGVGGRSDDDAIAVPGEMHRHRVGAVVTVERDVMRYEEAAGRPRDDLDRQVQLVTIDRRPGAHLDHAAGVLVEPATAVRRHLVRRRHVEQVVAVRQLDEDALAAGAEQAQVAARRSTASD